MLYLFVCVCIVYTQTIISMFAVAGGSIQKIKFKEVKYRGLTITFGKSLILFIILCFLQYYIKHFNALNGKLFSSMVTRACFLPFRFSCFGTSCLVLLVFMQYIVLLFIRDTVNSILTEIDLTSSKHFQSRIWSIWTGGDKTLG